MSLLPPFGKNGTIAASQCGLDVTTILHAIASGNFLKLEDSVKLLKQRKLNDGERFALEVYGFPVLYDIAKKPKTTNFRLILHQLDEFRFGVWVHEHRLRAPQFSYFTEARLNQVLQWVGLKCCGNPEGFSVDEREFIWWAMNYYCYLSAWQFFRFPSDQKSMAAVT